MRNALRGAGSLAAVLAIAAVLVVGSQAIRQSPKAAVISPSPSAAPVAGPLCISPDATQCSSPAPTACVGGEGTVCATDIVPSATQPTPTTAPPPDTSAGTTGPHGQIQVSATWFVIPGSNGNGGKLALEIAVLSGTDWVSGAQVTAVCSGPGFDQSISGTTAPRSSWQPTINPSVPSGGPATFFWSVMTGSLEEGPGKYVCHGSASYNGLSASF